MTQQSSEIAEAREQVRRTRERLEATYGELGERITEPARRTASALDLTQKVKDYPWPALALALGAGVLAATTGMDRRAATAAAATARQAGRKSATAAVQTAKAARTSPSRAKGLLSTATDTLATRVLTTFMGALRERPGTDAPTPPSDAIGFVRETTPAFGDDHAARRA